MGIWVGVYPENGEDGKVLEYSADVIEVEADGVTLLRNLEHETGEPIGNFPTGTYLKIVISEQSVQAEGFTAR